MLIIFANFAPESTRMYMNITIPGAKGLFLALTLSVPSIAMAEGYQVNTLSARQLGMAHTGYALKLGAESQFFNPAGMAYMDKSVDFSASFNALYPECTAIVGGKKYHTDNNVSTPLSFFAGFKIYDNLSAGISFYTPCGSGINWTDHWPGAILNQSVTLKGYTVQPTVSWRITPRLSVGAGLTINWGTVDLHKGLISGAQLDGMLGALGIQGVSFGEITPASAQLTGKAKVGFGYNLGVMYDFSDSFTAGINFRSKNMLKVEAGEVQVNYATDNPTILGILSSRLDGISKTEFKAEMPNPAVLGFGGAWHNDRLTLALDAQWTFWSAYKELDINFVGASEFDQHLEKNYHNSWLLKAGAEWKATPRLDLRAGLAVDMSPCDKEYYNPETPGMTKIEPTVGLTFRPLPNVGINAAFMYIHGCGVDNASYTSTNVLTGQPDKFTADYRLHAVCGSVGVSVSF